MNKNILSPQVLFTFPSIYTIAHAGPEVNFLCCASHYERNIRKIRNLQDYLIQKEILFLWTGTILSTGRSTDSGTLRQGPRWWLTKQNFSRIRCYSWPHRKPLEKLFKWWKETPAVCATTKRHQIPSYHLLRSWYVMLRLRNALKENSEQLSCILTQTFRRSTHRLWDDQRWPKEQKRMGWSNGTEWWRWKSSSFFHHSSSR